jgi:uncharacterized membrane protein
MLSQTTNLVTRIGAETFIHTCYNSQRYGLQNTNNDIQTTRFGGTSVVEKSNDAWKIQLTSKPSCVRP